MSQLLPGHHCKRINICITTCTLITHCLTQIAFSDLDECVLGSHSCDGNAQCNNIPGSFTCRCNYANGYYGNGTQCFAYRTYNSLLLLSILYLFNLVTLEFRQSDHLCKFQFLYCNHSLWAHPRGFPYLPARRKKHITTTGKFDVINENEIFCPRPAPPPPSLFGRKKERLLWQKLEIGSYIRSHLWSRT